MPDILIRGLDEKTIKQLKTRARRAGRSLQSEAKMALESAAGTGDSQVSVILDKWHNHFSGRKFSSSAALIREDRRR